MPTIQPEDPYAQLNVLQQALGNLRWALDVRDAYGKEPTAQGRFNLLAETLACCFSPSGMDLNSTFKGGAPGNAWAWQQLIEMCAADPIGVANAYSHYEATTMESYEVVADQVLLRAWCDQLKSMLSEEVQDFING